MEVAIFRRFQAHTRAMDPGYIDLGEINHLASQARGGGVFDDRDWRESYYFNLTDRRSDLSLITTIGMLPNRKRTTGFVLLLKNGKAVFLSPLVEFSRPRPDAFVFRLKGLEYAVEGAGWRLRYQAEKCAFDLKFSPVNRIFPYVHDGDGGAFSRLGSQHYEQSGIFEGELAFKGRTVGIGPSPGHRDHSWGPRDWSAPSFYPLFCCAFSRELAFNLWEGRIGGDDFVRGYVFDGSANSAVVKSDVATTYEKDGKRPLKACLRLQDNLGRTFEIESENMGGMTVPVRGSLLSENIGRMACNGLEGAGLMEYLDRETGPVPRMRAWLDLVAMVGGM